MAEPDDEINFLIDFINQEMIRPHASGDDLEVALPPGRTRGEWVRGLKVEENPLDHNPFWPKPSPKPKEPPTYDGGWAHPWKRPKPPYRCVCGIVFATAEELRDHRHPERPPKTWTCYCGARFYDFNLMLKHRHYATPEWKWGDA
jgi:hypothetical protein